MASLSNKAMENVQKEHMTMFHKRLPVCDLALGPKILQQVWVHYNMNPNPKMMIEKLQLLVSLQVNNEQKVSWLKQWNQSSVLKEAQKFPKVKLSNAIFEKWLHKATFWFQVPYLFILIILWYSFYIFSLGVLTNGFAFVFSL